MDWLDIVKLALPAAICAFALGPRTAIAALLAMVAVMVFGLEFWSVSSEEGVSLAAAAAKVLREGPPAFTQMVAAGAFGIIVGWWLRTWFKMARSSPMTREPQSPI